MSVTGAVAVFADVHAQRRVKVHHRGVMQRSIVHCHSIGLDVQQQPVDMRIASAGGEGQWRESTLILGVHVRAHTDESLRDVICSMSAGDHQRGDALFVRESHDHASQLSQLCKGNMRVLLDARQQEHVHLVPVHSLLLGCYRTRRLCRSELALLYLCLRRLVALATARLHGLFNDFLFHSNHFIHSKGQFIRRLRQIK